MDDTRDPSPHRSAHRAGLPFLPAALILALFSLFAVWPRVIPGLPRAPRLGLLAALLAGTLVWLSRPAPAPPAGRTRARRSRPARARRPAMPPAAAAEWVASPAWLQIVSGPDAGPLTRGLTEIAGAWVACGERVLVVDGARRLRLHEALGHGAGPGLLECLAGTLPVLEAIQGGAGESLCFLPRGNPMRSEVWPQLGRLLLETRPHFDRVVLALDFAVPREAGLALEGLEAAAWWCPDGFASILSEALAERIGIPLRDIMLPPSENVMPEPAAGRPASIGPGIPPQAPAPSSAGPAVMEVRARPRIEAPVVDCDLQVRERLRFLVWMRSVQAEGRRELEAQH